MKNIYSAFFAFVLTATCLLHTADSLSQVPETMNYQAVLRNVNGDIMPLQYIGLRFKIHDGSPFGQVIYVEYDTAVSNQFGLIVAQIGGGTGIGGNFSTIDWSTGNKFLEVEAVIGSIPITMGTSQLISVPYALYAKNSGSSIAGPTGPTGPAGFDGINGPGYLATSTSQVSILAGIQTFVTQTGLAYLPNDRVRIANSPTNYMEGVVASYGGTSLTINVDRVIGSGTFSAWNIGIAGDIGATGAMGPIGITGPTGPPGASNAWGLIGNSGTVSGTNFIGTVDDVPLTIRVNNEKAGRIETDGSNHNVSIGFQSLNANAGPANSAFGHQAMFSNIDGGQNTGIGYQALYSNKSNWGNTAVGNQALYNDTSFGNTAIGQSALLENRSGYYNTALGTFTLVSNMTGSGNTAIGKTAMYFNISGNNNTAIGQEALYANSSGGENTAIGVNALSATTTGSNNIGLGNNAQVPNAAGNNQVRIGNVGVTYAGVQVAWTITSDRRWKSEIKNCDLGLDFIGKLRPVSYVRNNDENEKPEYGFIAQEVEEALNSSGVSSNGIISKDDAGMYGLRYNDLMAPMVKAIQELKMENEELRREIQDLKKN